MLTGSKKTNRKLHEQSLIQTLAAPKILRNVGWAFIMYEPASRTPFGIVASRAGAELHVELDTSAAKGARVALQYLESHAGMGSVRIECRGCACAPTIISATGSVARQSTLVTRDLSVSSHPHCELHIRVLNGTASADGGHKFKLARMFLTGDADGDAAGAAGHASPVPSSISHGRGRRGRRWRQWPSTEDESADVVAARVAARNGALRVLRAARSERAGGVQENSLALLLPPSAANASGYGYAPLLRPLA